MVVGMPTAAAVSPYTAATHQEAGGKTQIGRLDRVFIIAGYQQIYYTELVA